MHKCPVLERFVCVLSEAKKQAPVDSIQKSELTSYIEKYSF